MKKSILPSLCLLLLLATLACNNDDLVPEQKELTLNDPNQIRATIDGDDWVMYQADSLNTLTDCNFAFFQFGRSILRSENNPEQSDTSMFIQGSLNHHSIRLSFPFPKSCGSYDILRYPGLSEHPSACYQTKLQNIEGSVSEIYDTHDILAAPSNFLPKKTGEIMITRYDRKNRFISGTFWFKAYGYYLGTDDYYHAFNDTVDVTNGKFCFHWNADLEI
ncbi:MAG TPA: DUF6252 family protein [Prolixibacteraceae bacterium]|nr:DUF6252 family protein [Prolixibacteraceae bacterium]